MSAIRGWMHRLRVLANPEAYAREVEREIRFHLELEAIQLRGTGLETIAAELSARKRFGNVTYTREEVRRMSGIEWLDRIRQNVQYAWRGLRKSPGFTAAVVVTLGLGLGVNAAMFSFLDRVFVQPPAGIVNPQEVRRLYFDMRDRRTSERFATTVMRYPTIRELRREAGTQPVGVFVSGRDSITLRDGERSLTARRTLATTDYFTVLGVRPSRGRFFDAVEDRIEQPANVAIVSHAFWKRGFNGDTSIIGRTIRIKDRPVTIIGVAGEGFRGVDLDRSDLWMPISHYGSGQTVRGIPWYDSFQNNFAVIMRFADEAAEQRFLPIATRVARSVRMAGYSFDTTGFMRTGPIILAAGPGTRAKEMSISLRLGGVALIILLIAVANVSNLQLVRATRRARETAVRRALGVSRARLFEQLFTEAALLTLLAGATSIVLAFWVGSALRALLLPRVGWASGPLDLRTLLFAAGATLVTGIVVGVAPALRSWSIDVVGALKAGTKSTAFGRSRARTVLLVAQAALSVVLLVGAGLFVKSLRNVKHIDLGYDADRILSATVSSDAANAAAEFGRMMPSLMARVERMNGVEAVAAAEVVPMRGNSVTRVFLPGQDSVPAVNGGRGAYYTSVTPGYFRAVGLRLIAGRDFSTSDGASIVVNEAMANGWWPGESAVGKCVIRVTRESACLPVIGVVENTKNMSIMDANADAWYYVSPANGLTMGRAALIVRAEPGRHAGLVSQIRTEVGALMPEGTFVNARSMMTDLEPEMRPWRLGATLFTAMGFLALLVAAIGVYSVIAYSVSQRAHEMGVRIALGARLGDITRLVVGEGLRTVSAGIVAGILLALAAGKLVASLLYGISPRDPWVIAGAAAVLAIIGIAASVIPALRAASADPMTTLRVE